MNLIIELVKFSFISCVNVVVDVYELLMFVWVFF